MSVQKQRAVYERDARAFLRNCLDGVEPTVADLSDLSNQVREGLHLDFKGPDWVNPSPEKLKEEEPGDPVRFARRLPKWVAGFANVGGGVLIIGASEVKVGGKVMRWQLDPIKAAGWTKEKTDTIVAGHLASMRPYVPPHRHWVVEHDSGVIIVVAVDRAAYIVPCVEEQRFFHYIRIGDNTYAAPAYLIEDMQLGKHRRSVIELVAGNAVAHADLRNMRSLLDLGNLELWNESLVHMREASAGIVYYSEVDEGPISHALRASIDVRDAPAPVRILAPDARGADGRQLPKTKDVPLVLRHGRLICDSLDPFEKGRVSTRAAGSQRIFIPRVLDGGGTLWRAAMYVICKSQPPTWFQLTVHVDGNNDEMSRPLQIRKAEYERPVVGYQRVGIKDGRAYWLPGDDPIDAFPLR